MEVTNWQWAELKSYFKKPNLFKMPCYSYY